MLADAVLSRFRALRDCESTAAVGLWSGFAPVSVYVAQRQELRPDLVAMSKRTISSTRRVNRRASSDENYTGTASRTSPALARLVGSAFRGLNAEQPLLHMYARM